MDILSKVCSLDAGSGLWTLYHSSRHHAGERCNEITQKLSVGVLGKSGLRGDGAVTELLSQVAKGMIPEF